MKHTVHYALQQLTWMIAVTRELILAMGIGFKWITMTIRVMLFGILVAPSLLTTVIWYIVSPSVIRRVAYRTSKKTRQRHLQALVRSARKEATRRSTSKRDTQHDGGESANGGESKLPVSGGKHPIEESAVSWGRSLRSSFLTPFKARRDVTRDAQGATTEQDERAGCSARAATKQIGGSETNRDDEEKEGPQTQQRCGEDHTPDDARSSCHPSDDDDQESSVIDESTSSDADTDEDIEDTFNVHNRATLDIFLPCPLDELLRVQQRMYTRAQTTNSQSSSPRQSPKLPSFFSRRPLRNESVDFDTHNMEVRKYPIAILVSGGAWIIGSHLWSAMMAKLLAAQGYLVFCPDYRNFPQSNMAEMTRDVSDAIGWVMKNAERYNGDLERVTLLGQSAGAHLCWMSLISQSILCERHMDAAGDRSREKQDTTSGSTSVGEAPSISTACVEFWLGGTLTDGTMRAGAAVPEIRVPASERLVEHLRGGDIPNSSSNVSSSSPLDTGATVYGVRRYDPRAIHHYIALSGIYDLPHLIRHFHGRGLYRKVLYKIAGGKERLRSEFCINRYFETHHHHHLTEAHKSAAAEASAAAAAEGQNIPEQLLKALRTDNSGWTMEKLLNDTFREPECIVESFPSQPLSRGGGRAEQAHGIDRTTWSPLRPGDAAAGASFKHEHGNDSLHALQFMNYLPSRISFLHGDQDCSAPLSEPMKLANRISECQHLRERASPSVRRIDVRVVCIAGGTHTNIIVEELCSGRGTVVRWLCDDAKGLRRASPMNSAKALKRSKRGSSTVEKGPRDQVQKVGSDKYDVIPMEVPTKTQCLRLRLAAFLCPF